MASGQCRHVRVRARRRGTRSSARRILDPYSGLDHPGELLVVPRRYERSQTLGSTLGVAGGSISMSALEPVSLGYYRR